MPDQTIEAKGIQKSHDCDLKQKSDSGIDRKSRNVHAIDVELPNHDTLPSCRADGSPDSGSVGSVCSVPIGRYGGASSLQKLDLSNLDIRDRADAVGFP